jgi:hypothetical protein
VLLIITKEETIKFSSETALGKVSVYITELSQLQRYYFSLYVERLREITKKKN